jgi:hypothetical protein
VRRKRAKAREQAQVQSQGGIDAFGGDAMDWFGSPDLLDTLPNLDNNAEEGYVDPVMDNRTPQEKPNNSSMLTVILEIIPKLNAKLANKLIRSLSEPIEKPLPFSSLSEYHRYTEQQSETRACPEGGKDPEKSLA